MPTQEPPADSAGHSSSDSAMPAPVSPLLAQGVDLSPDEVRELWSFLHGDVMEPVIRAQLREALGLCSRHAGARRRRDRALGLRRRVPRRASAIRGVSALRGPPGGRHPSADPSSPMAPVRH